MRSVPSYEKWGEIWTKGRLILRKTEIWKLIVLKLLMSLYLLEKNFP